MDVTNAERRPDSGVLGAWGRLVGFGRRSWGVGKARVARGTRGDRGARGDREARGAIPGLLRTLGVMGFQGILLLGGLGGGVALDARRRLGIKVVQWLGCNKTQ